MRVKIENCGSGIGYEMLSDATLVVERTGVRATGEDAYLVGESKESLWDVWREIERMKEKAENEGQSSVVEQAITIQTAIESLLDSKKFD